MHATNISFTTFLVGLEQVCAVYINPQSSHVVLICSLLGVTGIIDIFKFSSIKGEPSASTSKSSEQELPDVSPTGTPQSKTDVQQPHSQAQHPKSRTETGNLNGNNRPMDGTKRRSVHFSEPATQEEKELAQGRGELDVPRLGVIGRTTSHIRHAFRSNASPLNPTNDEETGLKK
jgi:hypothetical protein